MLIQVQYVKIPPSEALNTYTEKKLKKLTSKYEMINAIDIYFKTENTASGDGNICEIECSIPGKKLFASATKIYFEHAFKVALAEIEKQLKKKKALMTAF